LWAFSADPQFFHRLDAKAHVFKEGTQLSV
jgi:hypothetical protein